MDKMGEGDEEIQSSSCQTGMSKQQGGESVKQREHSHSHLNSAGR